MKKPIYPPEQLAIDKPFVLKKLGFSEAEFEAYMSAPVVDHSVYGNSKTLAEEFPVLKIFLPIKYLFIPKWS